MTKRVALKILSVTQTGIGEKTVLLEDKGEQVPYILRDDDSHGMAPYLRKMIDQLIELGQITVLVPEIPEE